MTEVMRLQGVKDFKNGQEVMRKFGKRVPWASAQALNILAADIRKDTIENVAPSAFTIRRKSLLTNKETGFNRVFASKTQLEAEVFSNWGPFGLHEEGGIKHSVSGTLKIPQKGNLGVGHSQVIPSRKRPRALVPRTMKAWLRGVRSKAKSTSRAFEQRVKGKLGIWQRTGDARLPIRPLYFYAPMAKIRAVFKFGASATNLVNRKYKRIFGEELAKEITKAKAKGWELT